MVRNACTLTKNRWKTVACIECELDEHLPSPLGNACGLSQVILNLIVNAADAIAERGDDHIGAIAVRTYADTEAVYVEVQDSGPGIPSEIQEKIFDPFFTTKEVGKGTGQGLSLCYEVVVRHHGGAINVSSAAGTGATFVVRLPLGTETTSRSDDNTTKDMRAMTLRSS